MRQDILSLKVTVYHDDCCRVFVYISDNDGHGFQTGKLAAVIAAVSRNQLIAALLEV